MTPETPGMEPSDEESIRRLLALCKRGPRRRPRQGPLPVAPRARVIRTCSCGQCPRCRDNAKWERIFEEKFADPNYYRLPVVRMSSPLGRQG